MDSSDSRVVIYAALVGNALIFPDELERTTDLRDRDLVGFGELAEEAGEEEE